MVGKGATILRCAGCQPGVNPTFDIACTSTIPDDAMAGAAGPLLYRWVFKEAGPVKRFLYRTVFYAICRYRLGQNARLVFTIRSSSSCVAPAPACTAIPWIIAIR